ncbi:MAG: class II SORL domain-containing protein [Proteobacteria bacterium]|nr:class II SORL domain-containing protein [Pseudomonadota bacterium]
MAKMGELYKSADWKSEKHVPVIDCPDQVKADEMFAVTVTIGKEVAHPNTTEHHIQWVRVYFMADGGKFPYQVGDAGFLAHGASADGANEGPVHTDHTVTFRMKIKKPGTIFAASSCNIHGLWENSKPVKLG